jgi:beta-1,4-mannosyl-glycoprotein beta-1,4-N-acetylglucosaminyltransferase|tara:strand:+ start:45 stop:848 length:804 start_codon:yes stop_codon:yes gene_type:complete
VKIFDCVTFFEENRLMSLRFNILNKYVDYFIVCEGKYNHQGKKKKINFNKKKYPKFKNKIKHILVDKFPETDSPWERQAFQREEILNGLNQASDDDLILFSDPDEIPNLSNFNKNNFKKKYTIFLQNLFYYKLNIEEKNLGNNWEGTRGCLKKNLKSIDYMRQKVLKKNLKYGFWRIDKEKNIQIIKNGGWHFSYLLTPLEIQRKIKTFAHTEYNKKKFTSLKNIKYCIKNLKDLFHRNVKYKKVRIDNTFPKYILENKKKLSSWII